MESKPVYVTVGAYDQFAQDVIIGLDREKAIEDAQKDARDNNWAYEDEETWPNNKATPGHSTLIYHVQMVADECENYISVFEVYPEA